MGRFVTILSEEEHSCEPLPGWFSRWVNELREDSVIKCAISGCGQYWKLHKDERGKLVWREE